MDRPTLEIRLVGEGIAPGTVPIGELASILQATQGLIKALATEQGIAPPVVAVVGIKKGSDRFAMTPIEAEEDEPFGQLLKLGHSAAKSRGKGHAAETQIALDRLYRTGRIGAIQIAPRVPSMKLRPVLMAQPLHVVEPTVDVTTILYGRVSGIVAKSDGYEILVKPRDGGSRISLFTDIDGVADRAAKLFNRSVRARVKYAKTVHDDRSGFELVHVATWEPKGFLEIMSEVGEQARKDGHDPSAEAFLERMRAGRLEDGL